MARSRNIKPGFFRDEHIVELPFEARLLFIGLWTLADREGRLKDKPNQIKIDIFPCDNVQVDKLLDQLQKKGFVIRYKAEEEKYIQVVNFSKHQNPHIKEPASEIPAPDLHHASTVQEPDKPDADPADSLNLIPDSLNPIYTVFDHWNSKGIIAHRELTNKLKGHINARLENYTLEEILAAIDNYATVLKGEEYFFSYKWSLEEFLTRGNGLIKFLSTSDPLTNYLKNKSSPKPPTQPPHLKKIEFDEATKAAYATPYQKKRAGP
jgi:hypothetical protein